MAMSVELNDEEGVVKGAHYFLLKRCSLEKLEREVYELLKERGPMPLSAIWRNFDCHLWEVSAVLGRLKKMGLAEESDTTPQAYERSRVSCSSSPDISRRHKNSS